MTTVREERYKKLLKKCKEEESGPIGPLTLKNYMYEAKKQERRIKFLNSIFKLNGSEYNG